MGPSLLVNRKLGKSGNTFASKRNIIRTMSFEEEFEALLKGNRIDFDEKYLWTRSIRPLRGLGRQVGCDPRLGCASPGAITLSASCAGSVSVSQPSFEARGRLRCASPGVITLSASCAGYVG